MKNTGNKSLRTMGSLTLCRSLLKAGLMDRFRVVVFPVITGSSGQDRIYDGYPDVSLQMIGSRAFDGRLQLLKCVPTVSAGSPAPPDPTLEPDKSTLSGPRIRWPPLLPPAATGRGRTRSPSARPSVAGPTESASCVESSQASPSSGELNARNDRTASQSSRSSANTCGKSSSLESEECTSSV